MFLENIFFILFVSCSMMIPSNSIVLDCEYSVMTNWQISNIYTCSARVIFVGDTRHISDVSYNHMDGRNNSDVKGLRIWNQNLTFIPRNFNLFFPNLESLVLERLNAKEITREDLKGLGRLRELSFIDNNLRVIEFDLFIENPLMERISLEYNPLRHVAYHVFDQLYLLQDLWLGGQGSCIQKSANNESTLIDLLFQLFVNCPPTFEMTETKIVNGDQLQRQVDRQITERIDPLIMMLLDIEEIQKSLQRQIEVLEARDPATSSPTPTTELTTPTTQSTTPLTTSTTTPTTSTTIPTTSTTPPTTSTAPQTTSTAPQTTSTAPPTAPPTTSTTTPTTSTAPPTTLTTPPTTSTTQPTTTQTAPTTQPATQTPPPRCPPICQISENPLCPPNCQTTAHPNLVHAINIE